MKDRPPRVTPMSRTPIPREVLVALRVAGPEGLAALYEAVNFEMEARVRRSIGGTGQGGRRRHVSRPTSQTGAALSHPEHDPWRGLLEKATMDGLYEILDAMELTGDTIRVRDHVFKR